jgi:hypothetical protein
MTPRIYLDWREVVRVFCAECGHEGLLDLQELIARGLGQTVVLVVVVLAVVFMWGRSRDQRRW